MAGLPAAPPIRALIERSRAFAARPFIKPALRWRRLPRTYGSGASASSRWFALLRLTFLVMVVVPAAASMLYCIVIASPIYVSEARLAIRESLGTPVYEGLDTNEAKGAAAGVARGLSALLGGLGGSARAQGPFVFANYVTSLDYVAKLDANGWLRQLFTGPNIDFWSALRSNATVEQLQRYWDKHVTATVDRRSEVVLLRVQAFSPEAAQTLANRILLDGENILNRLAAQSRMDAVLRAKEQLDVATKRYAEALVRQQEWRLKRRAVDPAQAADALSISLLRLEQERIAADREIRAMERLSVPNGPTLGVLRDRVRAIESEIATFKANLTGGGNSTAVAALAAYEESELDVRFAETLQSITLAGLQEAERRARAQSTFINVYVAPSLPETSSGPIWWQTGFFVFVFCGIIWINVMILVAVVRDHRR